MNFQGHDTSSEAEMLANSFLFSGLAEDELLSLSSFVARKSVPPKTTILRQGETGSKMFAIISGKVKVSVVSENGKEAVLGILGKDEFFGEMALFDGRERSASVIALEPTELLTLERASLVAFLKQTPQAAMNLLSALSQRLRTTNALFEDSVFLNLPSRLAKKLLSLAHEHGVQTPEGLRIDLRLSQQEVANLVGTTRESVNRLLRLWEEQEVIRFEDGQVTILDTGTLEAWQK